MQEREFALEAAESGLLSVLYRLRRGDSVTVGTDTGPLRDPRELTVERVAEERTARDGEIYYRVHLRGSRDGHYVLMPENPGKGVPSRPSCSINTPRTATGGTNPRRKPREASSSCNSPPERRRRTSELLGGRLIRIPRTGRFSTPASWPRSRTLSNAPPFAVR